MSQAKNRRRRARKDAQKLRSNSTPIGAICVLWSGTKRNPIGSLAPLDMAICAGFGSAIVLLDDEHYLNGDGREHRGARNKYGIATPRTMEKHIKRMGLSRRRWRIEKELPLWSAAWERRGPGKWVCVEAGMGFA
jgi:hypothetical protein